MCFKEIGFNGLKYNKMLAILDNGNSIFNGVLHIIATCNCNKGNARNH